VLHASLILPYAVEDTERKKPFTHDMEVATVLCLAEARRKKLGILGISQERVSFLSKLHYPFWAVPWGNECLLVDGLGILSHTAPYMKPPDVKRFTEDIERSATVRALYRSTLKSHAQTFKDFIDATQVSMEAMISNKNLLAMIARYVEQGTAPTENMKEPFVLTPPKLDEKAALEKTEKMVDHWGQIQSEIRGFQYAINVLNEKTEFHEQKTLREIEQTRETYENEILRVKPVVEKRVERLMMDRDAKIGRATDSTERKLSSILKEKNKHEQKLQRLERSKAGFEEKREARKRRGDKPGVARWDREIKNCQSKISEARREIQALSQLIERTRKEGEGAIKKLNEEYQATVDQEEKKIADLEHSRASEIEAKEKEMEGLRSEASSITNLIGRLMEQKRLYASKLKEDVTIPWRPEEVTLICVPFYLVRYETEAKSRYHVYAPMVAMGYEGIIKRIQKAVWSFSLESRIKRLLRPRSEALRETLGSALIRKMHEDKVFEETLYEMGCSNNILKTPNFRETLTKGMEELKNEGWITSEEMSTIINAYAPH